MITYVHNKKKNFSISSRWVGVLPCLRLYGTSSPKQPFVQIYCLFKSFTLGIPWLHFLFLYRQSFEVSKIPLFDCQLSILKSKQDEKAELFSLLEAGLLGWNSLGALLEGFRLKLAASGVLVIVARLDDALINWREDCQVNPKWTEPWNWFDNTIPYLLTSWKCILKKAHDQKILSDVSNCASTSIYTPSRPAVEDSEGGRSVVRFRSTGPA
jgi:hypothetical protein